MNNTKKSFFAKSKEKVNSFRNRMYLAGASAAIAMATSSMNVSAEFKADDGDFSTNMEKIINILLGISKWAGIGLVAFGVYEIVMSFMQNQPEAKTKGIIMACAGVVMVGLPAILTGFSLVGSAPES